jgi:hypothetical protein
MALSTISSNLIVLADNAVTTAKIADNAVTTAKITDANITTAKVADDAVTSAKLGLTFSSGSATQDGTANNTTYDMVTGLTIPAKALLVVSFTFTGKSGENGTPGSNATCAVHITNSSNSPVDSLTGTFMTNQNPKTGWRDVDNTISYFNETGSALTSHKIRVQQYADGDFNSALVTVKYKIIGLG